MKVNYYHKDVWVTRLFDRHVGRFSQDSFATISVCETKELAKEKAGLATGNKELVWEELYGGVSFIAWIERYGENISIKIHRIPYFKEGAE